MSTTLLLVDLAIVAILALVAVVVHVGRRARAGNTPTRGVVDLAFGVLITVAIACIMVWLAGVVPSFR